MPTMISGFRATTDLTTQRLAVDIAAGIALLDPNENPLTLLTKKVGKITAKQPKHSWLEDELRPEKDQINYGAGYASGDTSIVVDNGTYFAAGDLWQVFDSYEIIKISSISTNTLTVVRNFPGVSSGETGYNVALTDNDWLTRLGNVNEEGATAPTSVSTTEVQVDNYTHIIRTPFQMTETELNSLMEGEQDLPYQTRKHGIEHSRAIEHNFLWGLPGVVTSGTGPARTMGGVWWYMKENANAANIVSQADITQAEFLTFIRNGFRYGSRSKVLFACPLILSAIESWGLAKLEVKPSDKTFGINTQTWISPHGNISIINHKMLEGPNPGTAGGWAFLLDMDKIKYVSLRNRDTKLLTGRQANDADKYMAEYLTECSLQIKNPNCHAVLYNVTSFS